MRRIVVLCSLALALGATGCSAPLASTGWNFSVGRPATMLAPAIVTQGPGVMALYPVGTVASAAPTHGAVLAAEAPCQSCPPCPPAQSYSSLPAPLTMPPASRPLPSGSP